MRSKDVPVLQQLVTAANGWRTTAASVAVSLDILTTQINGQTVILSWNESDADWDIRTQ